MTTEVDQAALVHAMTVDVEDYFQVQAFANTVKRADWETLPSRVEQNTTRILEQFKRFNIRATFFTLGWIAERHPALIKAIVEAGHELASHGYGHQLVHDLTRQQFRDDVIRAKDILETIGGCQINGYRAPTFSIGPRNAWAFEVLEETGHLYSSSVYPVRHDLYGNPHAPRFPHHPNSGELLEIPMTTLKVGTKNLPISGGGYFRLLPYSLYRTAMRRFCATEGKPGVFYFHPWEIDAGQPRMPGLSQRSKFRHYVNIAAVPKRLERLLQDFRWDRMDQVFAAELATA